MSSSKAATKPAPARHPANVKVAEAAPSSPVATVKPGIRTTHQSNIFVEDTRLYRFDPQTRIAAIRRGVPASMIGSLSSRMGMSKETMLSSLGLSRATISRKEKAATVLSKDESERVLGVVTLIDMVQTMVEQSGDPTGFDAARWVSAWLTKPLPALAGDTPASYLDTFEGQKLVAELLSMTQSGAYA